ncbi:MAG: hypothetical protein FWF59_00255 [Turicibacter sp.]|nr:hypothetical protein [Turicibacter sp.]
MNFKELKLCGIGLAVFIVLGACSTRNLELQEETDYRIEEKKTEVLEHNQPEEPHVPIVIDAEGIDLLTGATSHQGNTEASLQEGMGLEGSWVFGFESDITLEHPLFIDGTKEIHSRNDGWTNTYGRMLLLAQRDEEGNPMGAFDLIAPEGIWVYSPAVRFVAEGEYTATVQTPILVIHSNDFHLQNTIIDGNIRFASEEYKNSARATIWNSNTQTYEEVPLSQQVTGEID